MGHDIFPWHLFVLTGMDLENELNRATLTVNANKTKVPSLTDQRTPPICMNEQNIEDVDQLVAFFLLMVAPNSMLPVALGLLINTRFQRAIKIL